MTITSKLQALHIMAEIRRMEISGFAYTAAGDQIWMQLFTACESWFADHPCAAWERFAKS